MTAVVSAAGTPARWQTNAAVPGADVKVLVTRPGVGILPDALVVRSLRIAEPLRP